MAGSVQTLTSCINNDDGTYTFNYLVAMTDSAGNTVNIVDNPAVPQSCPQTWALADLNTNLASCNQRVSDYTTAAAGWQALITATNTATPKGS